MATSRLSNATSLIGELDATAEGATPDVERVSLPTGDAMTPDEVDQFLRWRDATFVTVIGDSHSGKTTLSALSTTDS